MDAERVAVINRELDWYVKLLVVLKTHAEVNTNYTIQRVMDVLEKVVIPDLVNNPYPDYDHYYRVFVEMIRIFGLDYLLDYVNY